MQMPEYCLFWMDVNALCMTKGEWSGWVQAIGSIGAIFYAGWIARRQTRNQAAVAAQDRLEHAIVMDSTLGALASHVLEEIKTVAVWFETKSGARDFARRFKPEGMFVEVESSLRTIPMHHLPSGASVNRLVGLLKAIKIARKTYAGCLDDLERVNPGFEGQAKMLGCATMAEGVKKDADRAVTVMRATGKVDHINSSD